MKPILRKSLVAQTASHLREAIHAGHWGGRLPGVAALAQQLAVSKDTVRAALLVLENEGALQAGGAGKCRTVVRDHPAPLRVLRVAILLEAPLSFSNAHSYELILSVMRAIEEAGHVCIVAEKSLKQLNSLRRVAGFIESEKADAWIVYGGTRAVLEWFSGQGIPVLAIGGRAFGLPIDFIYTDVSRAMTAAVDTFCDLGHRRIVLIGRKVWRDPFPSRSAQAFLDRLRHHGIKVSDFNLPEWTETPEGFERMMESLFKTTPPTALIIVGPAECVAARIFVAERGLAVPRDLSIVSIIPDPALSLHRPPIAHFEWTIPALVRQSVQWVKDTAAGNSEKKATFFHAKFRPGGSIGAVKKA